MFTFPRIVLRAVLSIAIVTAFWNVNSAFGERGILWHEQRFEHKERPRGGGGEVNWRDVFTKDGYYLYDFTIVVHSVRGHGSEFAEHVIDAEGDVWSAEFPAATPFIAATTDRLKGILNEVRSGGPGIRIGNDNTLVITGKTVYGTGLGDSGGNVEYTVSGLFIQTTDITKVPGRFKIAGIRGSEADRDLDKKKIQANIDPNMDFVRSYVKVQRAEARRIDDLSRDELKRELQDMSRGQLHAIIGWLDGPTLKAGVQVIDGATLQVAVDVMDSETLREAMTRVDGATLTEILKRLRPNKRDEVLPLLNDATRHEVENRKNHWRR